MMSKGKVIYNIVALVEILILTLFVRVYLQYYFINTLKLTYYQCNIVTLFIFLSCILSVIAVAVLGFIKKRFDVK